MPITINGNPITSNKLNTNDVTVETLNGNIVYQLSPPVWTYIGTSGSANGNYSLFYEGGSCYLSDTIGNMLTADRPPSEYSLGYIMRVSHSTEKDGPFGPEPVLCPAYYYRRD